MRINSVPHTADIHLPHPKHAPGCFRTKRNSSLLCWVLRL
ncbi:TPA: hypothetical protein ACPYU2_003946 [Escherichia coli]